MKKRGQITIFIILAILMVALAVLFFVLRGFIGIGVKETVETNPQRFIEICAEEELRNSIDLVLSQGGFLEPKDYKLHNDIKATYLCKNIGLFDPCVNQHPMLLNEISLELKNKIKPVVDDCFIELKDSFEGLGYEITIGEDKGINVTLAPESVYLEIDRSVLVRKADEKVSFDKMKIPYKSSLYALASIAVDIVRNEAKFCYFEYLGYMHLYPRYILHLKVFSDSTEVYSIKDSYTQEEMNIALRGCALG